MCTFIEQCMCIKTIYMLIDYHSQQIENGICAGFLDFSNSGACMGTKLFEILLLKSCCCIQKINSMEEHGNKASQLRGHFQPIFKKLSVIMMLRGGGG